MLKNIYLKIINNYNLNKSLSWGKIVLILQVELLTCILGRYIVKCFGVPSNFSYYIIIQNGIIIVMQAVDDTRYSNNMIYNINDGQITSSSPRLSRWDEVGRRTLLLQQYNIIIKALMEMSPQTRASRNNVTVRGVGGRWREFGDENVILLLLLCTACRDIRSGDCT